MQGICRFFVVAFVFMWAGIVAQAQTSPVAVLQCDGEQSANLSYYTIGVAEPSGTGAPALQPVMLHTSLSNFVPFFTLGVTGKHVSKCTLTATAAGGVTIRYLLEEVVVTSAVAVGRSARTARDEPGGMVLVTLFAAKVEVPDQSGKDDGGSTGGWDLGGIKAAS